LIAFKDLSSFKINFKKYEMVSLNISNTEDEHLANILGCKFSHLTITYFGVPLYFRKLRVEH
jgi:hypothetical protein